jgi:hypothetical protein
MEYKPVDPVFTENNINTECFGKRVAMYNG